MKSKQLLGLLGAAMLFAGVFCPIVSVPIMGNINFFQNGEGDGIFIIVFAGLSFILVLIKRYNWLIIPIIGTLAVLGLTYMNFQSRMNETKALMTDDLDDNPFIGLAEMAINSIQLQWGWAVLIIGVALLIVSIVIKDDETQGPIID